MELKINRSAVVITPSIGNPTLVNAYRSVMNQTYDTRHLIVCDGIEHMYSINTQLLNEGIMCKKVFTDCLKTNVGKDGYYGHRIYAAYSQLVDDDYVFFLDEDNWYEPEHVERLVQVMDESGADIGYSLRRIFDESGTYVCHDNCESLGPPYSPLIDTSSFCFRNSFIRSTGHMWFNKWGADRSYLAAAMQLNPKIVCSKMYSLNYRCGGNAGSVKPEFFLNGNKEVYRQLVEQKHGVYPWSNHVMLQRREIWN